MDTFAHPNASILSSSDFAILNRPFWTAGLFLFPAPSSVDFFINSDSKEQLLSACEQYIEEDSDAWQVIEVLAENQSYSDGSSIDSRELYYYEGDCSVVEDEDGNESFAAFAIFTIRQIQNNETSDQSYMLSGTLESDGSGRLVITELNTLTKIYFQAD